MAVALLCICMCVCVWCGGEGSSPANGAVKVEGITGRFV